MYACKYVSISYHSNLFVDDYSQPVPSFEFPVFPLFPLLFCYRQSAITRHQRQIGKKRKEKVHIIVYLFVVVVSHIQRNGCQPEKATSHGGQSRSCSTDQEKKKKKSLAASPPPPPLPPPPPPLLARSKKIK